MDGKPAPYGRVWGRELPARDTGDSRHPNDTSHISQMQMGMHFTSTKEFSMNTAAIVLRVLHQRFTVVGTSDPHALRKTWQPPRHGGSTMTPTRSK